ncbi:CDP-diacylglycerol--glycerol-3-phosphate 3-phosphatidyltransferase [Atopobium sp. oral taxon 810]|uniref:CDP-diacylglycerol--glycerol-3-phosphate 3-phosphatidyltransferase n=1 Tax=Atopobium sp. oral taxon 810 TaxID=712158 RepID=UPI000397B96A|nr:CDP-diacylglycerol--glycerol-3-phosphate 3-phosphatidyltransferase [Atopobium sp. oral taxon 810 str. F0209]
MDEQKTIEHGAEAAVKKPKPKSTIVREKNTQPGIAAVSVQTHHPRKPANRRPAAKRRPKSAVKSKVNATKDPTTKTGLRSSSVWTAANIVTCIRVLFIPVWLFVAEAVPASNGNTFSFAALLVALFYMAISLTDKLDGYLARSRGEITTFGKFLDPIADKLVVLVALSFLLEQHMVNSWVLLVIIAREFLVSGLRMVIASKGVVIAASELGKWKTAITMIAISGLLVVRTLSAGMIFNVLMGFFQIVMFAAVLLTAWSGIDYFIKGWRYLLDEE